MLNKPNVICGSALLSDPINFSFWLGASWLGKQNMSPKLALQTFYNLIETAAVQPVFTYLQTSWRMVIAAHIVLSTCTGMWLDTFASPFTSLLRLTATFQQQFTYLGHLWEYSPDRLPLAAWRLLPPPFWWRREIWTGYEGLTLAMACHVGCSL